MAGKFLIGMAAMLLFAALVTTAQDLPQTPLPADTGDKTALATSGETATQLTILALLRKGGPLMYPLYLCSMIMVGLAIERSISLRRRKILPSDTVKKIRSVSPREGDKLNSGELLRELDLHDSPISRVVKAGLRKMRRPVAEIEKAIEDAGEREADTLRRNCRVLSIVASVSPLLGLLGTVLGMIKAFMTVAASEDALGQTELLASGIYQALVTTAVGLGIAIPALVLYHFFTEQVERLVSEIDDITIELVEKMAPNA